MSVLMTYGGYNFEPVPQMTLGMRHVRNEAGELINIVQTATLQGKLVTLGMATPGPATLFDLQNTLKQSVSSCSGCQLFHLECDGTTLLSAYANVTSLTFSPSSDNWVFTADYTVELEWNAKSDITLISGLDDVCLSCLSSTNENWEVSIPDNPARYTFASCSGTQRNRDVFQVSHTVSAQGYNCCISGVLNYGWMQARDWVENRLGYTSGIMADVSGVFKFNPTAFTAYNHSRIVNLNKSNGEYSVQEGWLLLGNSGMPGCTEDFTVSVETDNSSRFATVNVQGTLNGLETRNAFGQVTTSKFESANYHWATLEPLLYNRAKCLSSLSCDLRNTPIRKSILSSPTAGSITYNYTFDSRPQLVTNSISEQITITDSLPSEQIAQIPVLGRRAGPILYRTNSINALEKRASISILMNAPSNCFSGATSALQLCNQMTPPTGAVASLLCCIESTMSAYTFYRTSDQQNWSPIDGQYQRDVTWLLTPSSCSGSLPGSFC